MLLLSHCVIHISQDPASDKVLKEYIDQKQLNDLFNSFSYNYQVAYEGHNSAAEQIGSSIENIGMVVLKDIWTILY